MVLYMRTLQINNPIVESVNISEVLKIYFGRKIENIKLFFSKRLNINIKINLTAKEKPSKGSAVYVFDDLDHEITDKEFMQFMGSTN